MLQALVVFDSRHPIQVSLPTFDLHKVEEALRVNHRLFNGKPLSRAQIKEAVSHYRRFLQQHKMAGAPERFEVPSLLIDRVWHTHMCETEQYERDCKDYFGKMIHHRSEICNGNGGGGGWD